jgi:hypothetical protein
VGTVLSLSRDLNRRMLEPLLLPDVLEGVLSHKQSRCITAHARGSSSNGQLCMVLATFTCSSQLAWVAEW